MKFENLTKDDSTILAKQLNSEKNNIAGIISRCKHGCPTVALLHPAVIPENNSSYEPDYKSISTLIWLTCPYLNRKIHDLENTGNITKIHNFILSDIQLLSFMREAHTEFSILRKSVFRKFCKDKLDLNYNDRIFQTGIGGISSYENIKCLHIHFAHYLIYKDNVAGKITLELLGNKIDCDEGNCKKCLPEKMN